MASRIAASTEDRVCRPDYAVEVRTRLDIAWHVITTTGRARLAEAGLSNWAFYRYFTSNDAFVPPWSRGAREGWPPRRRARRLPTTPRRPSADEAWCPEFADFYAAEKVRCRSEVMLEQTDQATAPATVSVLATSTDLTTAIPTGDHHVLCQPVADLLSEPYEEMA